ncbi:MAG: PAS domain-containing protein, partial [Coleofasciculus sp. C2-GNP5-27]
MMIPNNSNTQYILLMGAVGYVLSFSLILGVYKLLIQQIRRRQQIEETLRQTNDQLEQRVQERTTQLTQSNHFLQAEIEERIRVETMLKERDEQLSLAMEAAKMGSWDWDMLTNQVIWSKSHEQLFGLVPGTYDGTYSTFEACVHPDDRQSITQAINDALAHHQDYHHEFRVVWSDGTVHWMEGKGKFFYNTEGKAVRMLGTVIDITDRKQVELALQQANDELEMRVAARTTALCLANERLQQELFERQQAEIALRDSEEKFRQLAENIQDVFWISNPEKTQLIYVSPAYALIWGRRCERLYGNFRDWIDAIHPEDRQRVETVFFDRIVQGQYKQEYRIVRPDG